MPKLQVVQDTSTNWTPSEWRVLDRMKKNYAEMDERSGRPWKLGDDLLVLEPIGESSENTGRYDRIKDAALEVGCAFLSLLKYGNIAAAWRPEIRISGVAWSVFSVLAYEPDRVRILNKLVSEFGAEGVTVDTARRAIGRSGVDTPHGLKEYVTTWSNKLDGFMNQHLYAKDRLALEQLRLKIDILLGDAEEEAV